MCVQPRSYNRAFGSKGRDIEIVDQEEEREVGVGKYPNYFQVKPMRWTEVILWAFITPPPHLASLGSRRVAVGDAY